MAKGKKYNDMIKEKAFALLDINCNASEVARELKVPRTTVYNWMKERERASVDKSQLEKVRQYKRENFVNDAWEYIGKTEALLERRLNRALESEDRIDALLASEAFDDDTRKAIAKSIVPKIKLDSVKELAVLLGTLYDKAALASRSPTTILGGEVTVKRFEDL